MKHGASLEHPWQKKMELKNNKPAIVAGMTYGKGYVNDHVMNNENRWEKG